MSDFGELHHATMGCITSLEACLSVKPLMRKGWAESRLADMNLWASSVGALAKPETSLDQRLKFQPGPRIVLNNFLLTLQAFIGSCRMHALNGAGGRKLDEAEPDDTPVSPTESAFESTLDDDSELAQLIAWGSGPKTGSDTSTDSNAEDEVDEQSSETTLDKAMGDVDDLLDQLIMLGFAIRKSGTAARLRKADASFRDDENNDLRKHLVFILLKDVAKRQIDEVDMKVKVEEFMAKKDFHNVPPEQQHLILANLRRRHRFGYARRHQQKLDQPMVKPLAVQPQSALQPVPQPVVREPTLEDQRHHTVNNQKSSPTEGPPNAMLSTITRQTPHNGDLSETAPSTAEGDILKTIPFQAAASRVSVSVAKMHYPSPPPVGQQTKGFKCPCCYQTLPAMFQDPFRWKKHLTEDLRPYTCPFLECPRPEDLYISRAAWRDHIFGTHGAGEYWECLPCAGTRTPNRFPSVEEFITHNRTKHRDTISEDQISDLQDSCRKIAPPEISQCPLCPWPQDENPEPDASTTLEHIANCIHEFSLHALPWTKSYGVQTSNPPSYAVQRWLQTPEETDIRGLRESNITDVLLHSRFIDEPKASPEEREPLYIVSGGTRNAIVGRRSA
ncbi:hypothetical protein F5Y03DRAFT_389388 [Xylaria venustula]|nr:hypothetical protein F5Y03DRAFT_389388 [Xylaria venustula]